MIETDFGSHWTASEGNPDKHLIAYVEATGEIYSRNLYSNTRLSLCHMAPESTDQVELLMQGWTNRCKQPGSLNWVLSRARLVGSNPMHIYRNMEEFYLEDPVNRRYSGEADYGCHWKLGDDLDSWRIAYVEKTGEVYATMNGRVKPVLVLGRIEPDPVEPGSREIYYHTLDEVLRGWEREWQKPDGMALVRKRILAHAASQPA